MPKRSGAQPPAQNCLQNAHVRFFRGMIALDGVKDGAVG